jgi:cytochrome bd ubiquinol oxidase subunit I
MDLDALLLSRIQFAFVVSFHIIFPAFTIGLTAWLATIEGMRLATGNPIYRHVFDFWLKVFALSFGMGVVSGIVSAPAQSKAHCSAMKVLPPLCWRRPSSA